MMKKTICSKHEKIMSLCDEILDIDFSRPFQTKLKNKINRILKITAEAKISGQDMENRLSEYYEGIVDMGFKRKRSK